MTTSRCEVADITRIGGGLRTLPVGERPSVGGLKGMSETAKPRSDVFWSRNSGSPNGREPHGDGAPVVVGGRESRPQGEAGQVDRNDKEQGRRDVERRPPENPATGEPCAWKSCPHGSGRGGWNRARSRLAVTAIANGRVNELRRKPSTSPAAYSTEVQS